MRTYYLHDGRNESGPFTIDILKKQKLTRNTPIRQEGTNSWMAAEKLEALKEVVAPRKIKRPKDVFPVVAETVASFRKRRPIAAYVVLLFLALIAGVSIYSLGKGITKNIPKELVTAQHQDIEIAIPAVAVSVKNIVVPEVPKVVPEILKVGPKVPKVDKEKAARLHWSKLFSVTSSSYGIGFFGGIKDLKIIITNRSDYPIDEVVTKVNYVKAGGGIWKTTLVTVYGVPAHDEKEQPVPDVARGKKVTVALQKLVSKKLKFNYTIGKKGSPDDPYITL